MKYSVMCKVYTGYHGTSETEHGLCACLVDNPRDKARGLSLRTGTQTMLYPICAKDWASVDFGTTTIINNKIILVILVPGVVLTEFHGEED